MGVDIAPNTLSLWVIKTAQVLVPLYKISIITLVFLRFLVSTRFLVLNFFFAFTQLVLYNKSGCFIGKAGVCVAQ
jgi:hypothetical protein